MSSIRRWKRTKIDMRVKLRRAAETADPGVVVRTYEMSEGGMSLYVPDPIEVGTPVRLEFTLPGSERLLNLAATIRNRRGFRYGLEFSELPAAERVELSRYLASMADVIEI